MFWGTLLARVVCASLMARVCGLVYWPVFVGEFNFSCLCSDLFVVGRLL